MKFETILLIPNYNGLVHLKECLSSLEDQVYKNFKILFLDDKSTDGSVNYVAENFKDIEIIVNQVNYGFAKSVNEGILYALKKYAPKYIALLNNDVKVDKNWLKELTIAIESEDKIASVASNMFFYDNPEIINSQGGMVDFLGRGSDINFGVDKKDAKELKKYILSSCFGACLINVKYLDDIGILDQRYSAYFEDLDWGIRANIMGYKIIFEEKAVVYHKGSSTYGKNIFNKSYFCLRNSLCSLIKHYERINLFRALILTLPAYVVFTAGYIINRKRVNGKIVVIDNDASFKQRLKMSTIPLLSIYWNIVNLRETLRLRGEIQENREVDDNSLFKKFMPKCKYDKCD